MADRYSSHIAGPSSAPHKGGPGAAMPPASPAVHDKHEKPQLTLIQLVEMAMEAQGSRLTTAQICEWISTKFPYYTADPPKFKKSMRDTLSRNSIFINHKRSPGNPGLGDYWTIRKGRKHQVRVHAGVQASGIAPQDQEDSDTNMDEEGVTQHGVGIFESIKVSPAERTADVDSNDLSRLVGSPVKLEYADATNHDQMDIESTQATPVTIVTIESDEEEPARPRPAMSATYASPTKVLPFSSAHNLTTAPQQPQVLDTTRLFRPNGKGTLAGDCRLEDLAMTMILLDNNAMKLGDKIKPFQYIEFKIGADGAWNAYRSGIGLVTRNIDEERLQRHIASIRDSLVVKLGQMYEATEAAKAA